MGNIFGALLPLPLPLPLLPEDVLIRILVRLPVFTLLRFKSVCKSWRSLIESSFFIDLHTLTTFNSSSSSSSSKFDTFILQISGSLACEWERTMFMLSSSRSRSVGVGVGVGEGTGDDDQVVFKMDNLGYPSCYKETPVGIIDIIMVGSCNGLICLHDLELRDVSLWNPATRQFRILPKSITLEEWKDDLIRDFVIFGFDVETKDYKVVMITCRTCDDYRWGMQGVEYICRVQLYSLSSNSWRLLEGIDSLPAKPPLCQIGKQGLYLNGSYFFMGRIFQTSRDSYGTSDPMRIKNLILSFNFTKEIFNPAIQFPDQNGLFFVLGYLGHKMALFTARSSSSTGNHHWHDYDCDDYDIWVLNEHGGGGGGGGGGVNKESWTKLHSFRIKVDGCTYPIGIYNNGEFALIQTSSTGDALMKLQLFNLGTKETKMDFAIGRRVQMAAFYEPSLVSITGGNGAAAAAAADRLVVGAM